MTYSFPNGASLYCRTCEAVRPHHETDESYVGCVACGRRIHVAEVVATYSADEYDEPAPILLPWGLLAPEDQRFRLRRATDLNPIGSERANARQPRRLAQVA